MRLFESFQNDIFSEKILKEFGPDLVYVLSDTAPLDSSLFEFRSSNVSKKKISITSYCILLLSKREPSTTIKIVWGLLFHYVGL